MCDDDSDDGDDDDGDDDVKYHTLHMCILRIQSHSYASHSFYDRQMTVIRQHINVTQFIQHRE